MRMTNYSGFQSSRSILTIYVTTARATYGPQRLLQARRTRGFKFSRRDETMTLFTFSQRKTIQRVNEQFVREEHGELPKQPKNAQP